MESVNQIKEALSARSRTATLDELRSEGRKRVRLIRAEHVAQMVSEAVHSAIERSGLLDQEEVDRLVEQSRAEFKSVLREREQELQRARENEERLEQKDQELSDLKGRFAELTKALTATRVELEQVRTELEVARELPPPSTALAGAPAPAATASPTAPAAAAAPAGAPSTDMLLALVHEMATLKANLAQPQAPAVPDFSAALEKLTGTLNQRLESLGKKMGVSAAVDGDAPVDFGGMFRDSDKQLESNMDDIKVKQKAGGGIAANLAKLKKLKGGG